jgi:hypothetical protein
MLANFAEVLSLGALNCVRALPASSRALAPEDGFSNTLAASLEIRVLVPLFIISNSFLKMRRDTNTNQVSTERCFIDEMTSFPKGFRQYGGE